ncbi:MAG: hypothetical protein Q8J78_15770 [Moraxellaceae bacterium]|nr:hypothetical protein [Moraxellaceae bacterium]
MKFVAVPRVLGLMMVAGFISQEVQAGVPGWHIGGSVGHAMAEIDKQRIRDDLLASGFVVTDLADDDSGTATRFLAATSLAGTLRWSWVTSTWTSSVFRR